MNDAKRVWKDGRLEQLGWPRADIRYRAVSRHPEAARLHLADRAGNPLTVEVGDRHFRSPCTLAAPRYSGDPDRSHGAVDGRAEPWSTSTVYDLTDPAVAGRIPFGVDRSPRPAARLGA